MKNWEQISPQDWYSLTTSQWIGSSSEEPISIDSLPFTFTYTPEAPGRLILNYTPPEFQLLIGETDFTHFIEHLTLERPRAELTTPYWWTGSLVLEQPIDGSLLPESLDDLENPSRWARGVYPVKLYFKKKLFATIRIIEYFYDEDSRRAEAKLGDVLSLLDFKSPPKDYKGLGFQPCSRILVNTVVNKILQEAGVLSFAVNVPGFLEVPPNKPNGSYIKYAQQLLGERGYWLYVDSEETVRSIALLDNTKFPLFSASRAEVDSYQRQRSPELPADKIVVTGSVEKFSACETENPQVIEEYTTIQGGDGKKYYALQRRETIWTIQEAFDRTGAIGSENIQIRRIKIEQARGAAFPRKPDANQISNPDQFTITSDPGGTAIIATELAIETKTFDSQGRLRRRDIISDKLLGIVLPDEFPSSEIMVSRAERVLEEYFEDPPGTYLQEIPGSTPIGRGDGVLRGKKRTFWTLFPIGTDAQYLQDIDGPSKIEIGGIAYINAIKEQVIERWLDFKQTILHPINGDLLPSTEKCDCQRFTYRKLVYQRTDTEVSSKDRGYADDRPYYQLGTLQPNSSLSRGSDDATPPNWETAKPRCGTCTLTIKGERVFGSPDYTPYKQREYEYQASTVQNSIEAGQLAGVIGNLQHGRSRERLISCPLPDTYLNDSTPFRRADIDKGSYILDSPSLVLAEDGLEVSWKGIYQGAIPKIPFPLDEVRFSNFSPNPPESSALEVSVLPPQTFYIGQTINVLVEALGGSPPYVLSVANLPAGIFPSKGWILGIASTIGLFQVEVRVRDSANNIEIINWELTIAPAPAPVKPILEIVSISVIHQHFIEISKQNSDIKIPIPPPINVVHQQTVIVSTISSSVGNAIIINAVHSEITTLAPTAILANHLHSPYVSLPVGRTW